MSTKSTIAHAENFHFYHDVMDDDHVYLELRTTEFEAGYGRVLLPIPLPVWETIRHLGAADLSLADQTDEELRGKVESAVNERIADDLARERSRPGRASLLRYFGAFVFGPADAPRDEQITDGLKHFEEERLRQRQLREAIEALRKRQPASSW